MTDSKAFAIMQELVNQATRATANRDEMPHIMQCSTEFIAAYKKCSLEDAHDFCCKHARPMRDLEGWWQFGH